MGSRILTEAITHTRRMKVIGLRGAWLKVRKRNLSKANLHPRVRVQKLEVGNRHTVFSQYKDVT
jgi:hypothetical protein